MAIVKHRPEVTLRGPGVLNAGSQAVFRVTLNCQKAVAVAQVTFTVVAAVNSLSAGQYDSPSTVCRLVAKLVAQPVELNGGEHHYDVKVDIPADAPGSYDGRWLKLKWSAIVHVDIPWWPDRRAEFELNVRGRGSRTRGAAQVFVSDLRGPSGGGPYSELSIASTTVQPGAEIVGNASLSNVSGNRYRGLSLVLVGKETMPGSSTSHPVATWRIPLENPVEEQPIPFRLRVPSDVTAQFQTRVASLQWALRIDIDIALRSNVSSQIPITIADLELPEVAREEMVPLAVGSDRLRAVWRAAAQRARFDYADERLATLVDGQRLQVWRERRRRGGTAVFAGATLREIDLGLFVDRGRLRCRDDMHSRLIAEATDALGQVFELSAAADAQLLWTLEDGGVRVEPLVAFAQGVERFVRAFVEARDALPAPAAATQLEPTFARVARNVGGRFVPAGMDVFGDRDGLRFSAETRWGFSHELGYSALKCIVLTVQPLISIDGRYHCVWDRGEPQPTVPQGVTEILGEATGLRIDATTVEVYFPTSNADADMMTDRLERLIATGNALSLRAGGYR